jgi:hypothetical protein
MSCQETWQDVFLTKPEYGGVAQGSLLMDDVFVAPVMSVAVHGAKGASATATYAKPIKGGSKKSNIFKYAPTRPRRGR